MHTEEIDFKARSNGKVFIMLFASTSQGLGPWDLTAFINLPRITHHRGKKNLYSFH